MGGTGIFAPGAKQRPGVPGFVAFRNLILYDIIYNQVLFKKIGINSSPAYL